MARPDHTPAAHALALLRVGVGVVLVVASLGKLTLYAVGGVVPFPVASAIWQRELPARLALWLQSAGEGLSAAVVRDLLIPNGALVAGSIAWLQFGSGLLLVLGLFTRTAAVGAALVLGALIIAASATGSLDARPYQLLLAMSVAFMVGRAGHSWGLDAWRAEQRRHRDF